MKKNQVKIKKLKYVYYRKDPEVEKNPLHATFEYSNRSVKSYCNHLHIYVELSTVAQCLLQFLVERMDEEDNRIINHPSERDEFIKFMKRSINTTYVDSTVRKAFGDLKKAGYLIDLDQARRLVVNPKYYFSGTQEQRDIFIGKLLHQACEPGNKNYDIITKLKLEYF